MIVALNVQLDQCCPGLRARTNQLLESIQMPSGRTYRESRSRKLATTAFLSRLPFLSGEANDLPCGAERHCELDRVLERTADADRRIVAFEHDAVLAGNAQHLAQQRVAVICEPLRQGEAEPAKLLE